MRIILLVICALVAPAVAVDRNVAPKRRCELMNVTYAPCICDYYDEWSIDGYFVSCLAVQSAALIQEAFNKTEIIEHNSFYVTMDHFSALPADFLAHKKVQNLNFKCPNTSFTLGPVDLDAFRGTRDFTEYISIESCDLNRMNFDFLEGFTALQQLVFMESTVIQLQLMPHLPSFTFLRFYHCQQVTSWYQPARTPKLETLFITGTNVLDDPATLQFITGFKDSLIELKLHDNELTEFPKFAQTFTKLKVIDLWNNRITELRAGSLALSSQLDDLFLAWNNIQTIEPNAFRGDFSQTLIRLEGNNLVRFDSAIFRPLLETMARVPNTTGSVYLSDYFPDPEDDRAVYGANNFDCGCSISWLIYENRQLLDHIGNGLCSNGTRFEHLDPDSYVECYNEPFEGQAAHVTPLAYLTILVSLFIHFI